MTSAEIAARLALLPWTDDAIKAIDPDEGRYGIPDPTFRSLSSHKQRGTTIRPGMVIEFRTEYQVSPFRGVVVESPELDDNGYHVSGELLVHVIHSPEQRCGGSWDGQRIRILTPPTTPRARLAPGYHPSRVRPIAKVVVGGGGG